MAFLDDVLGLNSKSSIGDVQLDSCIRATHTLEGQVTEHAVESGQDVVDQYRIMPRVVELNCVITDTPLSDVPIPGASAVSAIVATLSGAERPSVDAFKALETYMDDAEVITVSTGLKGYTDMVLVSLAIDVDASTANALHFTARAKHVRFVDTESGSPLGFAKAAASTLGQDKKSAGKAASKEATPARSKSMAKAIGDASFEFGGSLFGG